jgi:hypothetical protein
MKRSMAREAEAERERRARIITADGEFQASKRLAAAAEIMSQDPAALQLRLLQTVVEVSAEKNSTLVMPLPVEILRFFDKVTGSSGQAEQGDGSKLGLGERLAKAEQELAKAAERPSTLESAEDVPPVIGLDEPKRHSASGESRGIASGEPETASQPGEQTSGDPGSGSQPGDQQR